MKPTVVMIRTPGGTKYAQRIGHDLNKLDMSYLISSVEFFPAVFHKHPELNPDNTIIHPRAAHPNFSAPWLASLKTYEDMGYRVFNQVATLMTTSNKLYIPNEEFYPQTWGVDKTKDSEIFGVWKLLQPVSDYVIKPYMSKSQGAHVMRFTRDMYLENSELFAQIVKNTPHNPVVVQEFIDYGYLHRVIILNGKALPYVFTDQPDGERWKVSVCLNKETMYFNPKPPLTLLEFAEKAQNDVRGEINFIDIFEDRINMKYWVGEINTACNLSIHERLSGEDISMEIAKTLKELYENKI